MNVFLTAAEAGSTAASLVSMLISFVILGVFFVFIIILPQKKEQKRMNAMLTSMEIGDYVLTSSGFYGIIIDITDDTVIVEFGNNKNCRIPMKKTSIAQVEKTNQ
ncbi:MAG: preprotein translocase subunit YajC [Lachnospiraceae bacterium]|nr:preprotein translocase subunit YajC [Lachnospiraceae bacterium]